MIHVHGHPDRDPPPEGSDAPPPGAVRCLKAAGSRSVWLVRDADGAPSTCKTWPLGAVGWIKWLAGGTQPQRHAKAVRKLAAADVRTPRILSGPRLVRREGRVLIELSLEFVEGRTGLEILAQGTSEEVDRAAGAVADLLHRLLRGGLFNRDLKLSNVLVEEPEGSARAWLLDPVDIRPMRSPRRQCARMLERLAVEAREAGIPIPRRAARVVLDAAAGALERGRRLR